MKIDKKIVRKISYELDENNLTLTSKKGKVRKFDNFTDMAEFLGIGRIQLWRKIKQLKNN